MVKKKMEECCPGFTKAMGWKLLILGLLVIANSYWAVVNWAIFIGIILAVKGILMLILKKK